MELEGTLRDFSLADIFQLIGLQRKTGVLTLRTKDDTVTVTFLDGKVVGADSLSHRLENRLGHVLIKSGLLQQDQLNRALEIQKETVVVGAEEADEVDFDGTSARKRKGLGADKIRISGEEKAIYDLVDGTVTVADIVEVSRFSEFDTNKALYELLTRDLIEEVKG